jgi:hypothetical protein
VVPEKFVPYAQALLVGETICYTDPAEMGGELAPTLAAIGVGSLYAVPIMSGAQCVGALVIGRPQPSTFNLRDRALVRLFPSHLSALVPKRDLVTFGRDACRIRSGDRLADGPERLDQLGSGGYQYPALFSPHPPSLPAAGFLH